MVEGHNVWRHCTEQFICSIKWNRLYWGRHLQEFHFHELTVSLKFLNIKDFFTWKLNARSGHCISHCIAVRLIDCMLFYVPFKNFSLIKRHQGKKKLGLYLILMTFVQREVFYFPWTLVLPNLFAFYHTDGYVVLTVCIRLRVHGHLKRIREFFFKKKICILHRKARGNHLDNLAQN